MLHRFFEPPVDLILGSALQGCVRFVQAQEFAKVLEPLFKQLAKCLNSSHFQARHRLDPMSATAVAVHIHDAAAGLLLHCM